MKPYSNLVTFYSHNIGYSRNHLEILKFCTLEATLHRFYLKNLFKSIQVHKYSCNDAVSYQNKADS